MAKNTINARVLLCLFLSQVTIGQVQVKSTDMKQALIFRPNQDAIRGRLAEVGEEHIVVLSSNREVTVPFADISRVILTHEHGPGRGPFYGAVLAGYASAYLFGTSREHGGFAESPSTPWILLGVLPSIAIGAAIGYLVDPGYSQVEEVFDFRGSGEEKSRERSRLVRAAVDVSRERKVHITFQGSHVNSSIPKLSLPGAYPYYDDGVTSRFNLLRRVQATYSLVPEVEAGIAIVWFGEPPQFTFGYEFLGTGDSRNYNGSQTFEAIGKYVVALYNPLYHVLDSHIDFKVGGWLGAASISYRRTTTVWTYLQSGTSSPQGSYFEISDNFLVGYLFGQLEFELVDGLSLGLVADK
ncbi:MAG: hypothetical protein AAB393_12875, partial [Bacteroidota bacterium]